MQNQETPLQILCSESSSSRVAISMVRCAYSGETRLRMRQESFSDDIGWFTQSHVDLSPDQISQLKCVLGPLSQIGGRSNDTSSAAEDREHPAASILKFPQVKAG